MSVTSGLARMLLAALVGPRPVPAGSHAHRIRGPRPVSGRGISELRYPKVSPQQAQAAMLAGVKVRSPPEAAIVQFLEDHGIDFEYEVDVQMRTRNGHRTWRTCDFALPRRGCRPLLWEHFDKWHDRDYRRAAREKMAMYRRHGHDVVVTYGTAPTAATVRRKLAPYWHELARADDQPIVVTR